MKKILKIMIALSLLGFGTGVQIEAPESWPALSSSLNLIYPHTRRVPKGIWVNVDVPAHTTNLCLFNPIS